MSEKKSDIIIAKPQSDDILDSLSLIASAVPWIGGPISNVISGVSFGRKIDRVNEFLKGIASDLKDFKSEMSEEYVKSEEFEELLENTITRAANERNEEKRRIFRSFLIDAVKSPGETYDEQMRILRVLEELQMDHIEILSALNTEPSPRTGMIGSPLSTLRKRLPDMDDTHIEDLVTQLNDMRVTSLTSLKTMMTGRGAADLRGSITPFGGRLIRFILKE